MKQGIEKALQAFCDSEDLEEAILASTQASWGGSGYSVELFPDGHYEVLSNNQIGNKYVSPGFIIPIPVLTEDEYSEDDPELSYFDAAIDELKDSFFYYEDFAC